MSAAAPATTTAQPAAPASVAPASVAPASVTPDWAVLGDILARSLEELAAAGRVHAACSLAGLACAATRGTDIRTWKRFNALLHRWSARAPEPAPPPRSSP